MANVLSQEFLSIGRGKAVVVTVLQSTARADSNDLPRMLSGTGQVTQLRRPGDAKQILSQTDIDTVAFTGTAGDEILLVSFHNDPVLTPRG
jgi:hypothetical protein